MSGLRVGFVGVGNMGGAMALRALSQGASVVAFDLSEPARQRLAAAGAEIVDSAAEVARRCDTISVVVNYDADVIAALDGDMGLLAGVSPGAVIAIHSTIHLETLHRAVAMARARSADVVDAAVTGGGGAAEQGKLAVLVGGPQAAVRRLEPAMRTYASIVMHAGDVGSGMAAKLAVMVISFGKLAATYEGLALANRAGIDTDELAKVVMHSEAVSGIHDFFLPVRANAFAHGPDANLLGIARHEAPKSQKDLHAAIELASRYGLSLPVTEAAHDTMSSVWGLELTV